MIAWQKVTSHLTTMGKEQLMPSIKINHICELDSNTHQGVRHSSTMRDLGARLLGPATCSQHRCLSSSLWVSCLLSRSPHLGFCKRHLKYVRNWLLSYASRMILVRYHPWENGKSHSNHFMCWKIKEGLGGRNLCLAPQGPEGHPLRPLFPEGSSHSYS